MPLVPDDLDPLGLPGRPGYSAPSRLGRLEHEGITSVAVPDGVLGIDVSHYQAGISMTAAKGAGAQFVIVKASENTSADPAFGAHVTRAKSAGLVVSAYHFLRAGHAAAQAKVFLAVIAGAIPRGTRVWADFEAGDHDTLHAFLEAVEAAGWPVGIYTGAWFWLPAVPGGCAHCATRPLWQSGYASKAPSAPTRWGGHAIWQFTDSFAVPGWPGGVDCSTTSSLATLIPTQQEDAPMAASEVDTILAALSSGFANVGAQATQANNGVQALVSVADRPLQVQQVLTAQIAGLQAQVTALAKAATGGGQPIDLAAVQDAAEKGAAEALAKIRVTTTAEALATLRATAS